MHTILDELILGGQVLETNSSEIVKAVEEISRFSLTPTRVWTLVPSGIWLMYLLGFCRLERASNAVMRMPKSIPGWQGR